ncbi:MAG: sulfatase [Lautropia sp.]
MRCVFVLFDSLNRLALEAYGDARIHTPNFKRFADRAVTFDTHYVGSLPCMPARREMHTGRLNFLHRSWGPLEPFDHSFSDLLRQAGIYTHLASDHYHYWEDGGAVYHNRYSSFDFIRGQEWDHWKAMVEPPLERFKEMYAARQYSPDFKDGRLYNMVNREFMKDEADYCCPRTFAAGLEFLDRNRSADNWFLQIEAFDPHEPFTAPRRFRERYPTGYRGPVLDWPRYEKVRDHPDEVSELRANYAALVTMCDEYFGRLLDCFDRYDCWKDTALVLSTDHGFLLAEHDWWGKNRMPFYSEIANIPLIVHHPAFVKNAGERRQALTQTIDLMPTFLDMFGLPAPAEVRGHSLLPLLEEDASIREAAIYGLFGAATNVTDGRYTYFKYPADMTSQELYEYTLMPTHLQGPFAISEFKGTRLHPGFDFTRGVPVLQIPARRNALGQPAGLGPAIIDDCTTALYDLQTDPRQDNPYRDAAIERRLESAMQAIMRSHDAPREAFTRLGFD